ncbi:helix-turn-helix domain-containing protein [Streptomyces sp. NBC_01235]|uniref:helix-turn-helix domain-containing protein n=1 Tax=Streptomyces sp. NBC_01235 TaxID=2903788 RepID=UPI002E126C97|nr:helix-turn-helix transcriptional regulator [Streptomyces sp. NBC_01235]
MSVPSFYGAELRYKREQAGLTLEQLAEGSFRGISFLSQIERGERGMPMDLARHVDQRLGADGFFERRCEDAAKARRAGHPLYFADVPDLEKLAETLEEWAPNVIPGLLQTEPYMRVLMRYGEPLASPELVEERVRARLARAELWKHADRPSYWGILRESLIRSTPIAPEAMAEQLEHILEVIQSTQGVVQIIPETVPWHPLMYGMAKIMTFADAPPLVWSEGDVDGRIADYPALVKEYQRSYDHLRAVALSPETSLALIEEAARNYRDAAQQRE